MKIRYFFVALCLLSSSINPMFSAKKTGLSVNIEEFDEFFTLEQRYEQKRRTSPTEPLTYDPECEQTKTTISSFINSTEESFMELSKGRISALYFKGKIRTYSQQAHSGLQIPDEILEECLHKFDTETAKVSIIDLISLNTIRNELTNLMIRLLASSPYSQANSVIFQYTNDLLQKAFRA